MPYQAGRPCKYRGCPAIVKGGAYCAEHKGANDRQYDQRRGSASERGYDHGWRKLRLMFLRTNPLCVECERLGVVTEATEVDHIIAKRKGGTDAWDNLQSLCKSCHSRKTAMEHQTMSGSTTRCTIVAGPPGAGKTTYARERTHWGDLIVDVDALFQALSGLEWYEKPECLLPFVLEARDAVINRLNRDSEVRHAWILTSEGDRRKLEQMKDSLSAELIVLDVGANECYRRISQDERRADKVELWKPLIDGWWAKFDGSEWGRGV